MLKERDRVSGKDRGGERERERQKNTGERKKERMAKERDRSLGHIKERMYNERKTILKGNRRERGLGNK